MTARMDLRATPKLRAREVDAEALAGEDLVDALYDESLQAVVVRRVFEPGELAAVVDALAHAQPEFPSTAQEEPGGALDLLLLGHSFTRSGRYPRGPEPARYYAEAVRFRDACRRLFRAAGARDFETRIAHVLGAAAGGREAVVPFGPGGHFSPSTLRVLAPGAALPIHSELEYTDSEIFSHLRPSIDARDVLSFFVVMTRPEGGGALELWDLRTFEDGLPLTHDGRVDDHRVRERYAHARLSPDVGDLLLFDGGRYYHSVSRVEGERPRRTIGGFASLSADHARLCFWG